MATPKFTSLQLLAGTTAAAFLLASTALIFNPELGENVANTAADKVEKVSNLIAHKLNPYVPLK